MPRVSVLLPVRNAVRTIRSAAVSVLRQTERDLELVCLDDGSADGTAAQLARIAQRDRRVRILTSHGEGIARSLSRGLESCDSEMIARMDADDVSHPQRLAYQLSALATTSELVAVGGRVRAFPRRMLRPGMARYIAWINSLTSPALVLRDLLVEAPLVHPASMIRRTALAAVNGWRDGPFPEDYDLWLRLSATGGGLGNVAELVLDWRDGPDRATRIDPRYALERHVALKASHLSAHILTHGQPVVIWGAGRTGKAFARALAAEGIEVRAFLEVDPAKIGRTLRGSPILSYREARRFRDTLILVAVGAPGARALIREELRIAGLEELRDFRCVS